MNLTSTVKVGGDERVSVIIPAHNAAGTIARAISSVRAQSFPVLEIIVVDDGSEDETVSLVRSLGEDILLLSQDNAGPAAARNAGAGASRGNYLAFLDADDYWYPEKISSQVKAFREGQSIVMCSTAFVRFPTNSDLPSIGSWDGTWIETEDFLDVLRNPYLGTPTVMMKKSTFESCGGFDTELRFGEDVDLWMRAAFGRRIARIAFPLVAVSLSNQSLTSQGGEQTDLGNLVVLNKFADLYPDFVALNAKAFRSAKAQVYTRLASSRLSKALLSSARSALREALLLDPTQWRAWYLYFRSYLRIPF